MKSTPGVCWLCGEYFPAGKMKQHYETCHRPGRCGK